MGQAKSKVKKEEVKNQYYQAIQTKRQVQQAQIQHIPQPELVELKMAMHQRGDELLARKDKPFVKDELILIYCALLGKMSDANLLKVKYSGSTVNDLRCLIRGFIHDPSENKTNPLLLEYSEPGVNNHNPLLLENSEPGVNNHNHHNYELEPGIENSTLIASAPFFGEIEGK